MENDETFIIGQMKQSIENIEKTVDEIKLENKTEHLEIKTALANYRQYSEETFAPKWAADAWIWTVGIVCGIVLATIVRSILSKPISQKK